jgi:hypothetical protein
VSRAEPHWGAGDHPGVIGLKHHRSARLVALAIGLELGVAPSARAWAGPPIDAEAADSSSSTLELEPLPDVEGPQPLRIVAGESSDNEALSLEPEPEPEQQSRIELAAAEPALVSMLDAGPPIVDAKRPNSGVGLITLGSMGLVASIAMSVTALAGPGWFDVEREHAMITGGASIPLALVSTGMLVGGARANKRYRSWTSRNLLNPPRTGTGMLIGGAAMTVAFAVPTVYATQSLMNRSNVEIGGWMPTVMLGSLTLAGVVVIAGGMLRRSKFTTWERTGYIMPGTMAVKGGGGVSLSGRF